MWPGVRRFVVAGIPLLLIYRRTEVGGVGILPKERLDVLTDHEKKGNDEEYFLFLVAP